MATKTKSNYQLLNDDHGLLVSFEGIDGCGKSTQIELLTKNLKEKSYNPLVLREPGGTQFGEDLRNAILNSTTKISPISEAYLFASSRAQLPRYR